MKGIAGWNHSPYAPLNTSENEKAFYICQLQPCCGGFSLVFRDGCETSCHMLIYRQRGTEVWAEKRLNTHAASIDGLQDQTDYEVAVRRDTDGLTTRVRLVRTGAAAGCVVNYLHPEDDVYSFSGRYLCSPSILALPSGKLLASMDVYGPQQAQNLTLIFESADGGSSWQYVTELYPCFWGKLFLHRGKVYMLGMSCEYGDLLIGVSTDEGHTWSAPIRLFNGSNARERGLHKAPMPVTAHEGRLYTAIDYGSWKYGGHDSCILSADEDSDLLCPDSWHLTQPLSFDPSWENMPQGTLKGCLEGNAIVAPDGGIVNLLRLQQNAALPNGGNAVLLRFMDADAPLRFDRIINFPLGANSKFVVLQEEGWYIAVGNEFYDSSQPSARNILSVALSQDLCSWEVVERVVDMCDQDASLVAFQYPDAQMVGDDLLILSRTAMNGANSYHNNNFITFHAVRNFRARLHNVSEGTERQ